MFSLLKRSALSREERAFWDENGYLLLKGYVSPQEVAEVLAIVDDQWANREGNDHHVDVNSGPYAGKWYTMQDVPPEARQASYKLNNLFGRVEAIRRIALNKKLKAAVQELLEGEPIICNSLNFERGSQQAMHIDSWYMPPPVDNRMVAASIALERVDADNGPIVYYPGSHKIPGYRFSDGRLNMNEAEGAACRTYLAEEIEKRGLKEVEVRAEPGDVFLWHGQLLHGGRPINDFSRTRDSLVIHYWRRMDVAPAMIREDRHGAYLARTLRGEIEY